MTEINKPDGKRPVIVQTAEAKRLNICFTDYGGDTRSFALLIDTSDTSFRRMLKGQQPINMAVIKAICYKLGYSTEWFILGTGNKKRGKEDKKLTTEISLLRQEMEIMLNKNKALEARMLYYENEQEHIRNLVEKIPLKQG